MLDEDLRGLWELATGQGALLFGDFELASGARSGYYFDGKKVTLSPEGAYRVAKRLLGILERLDVAAIGGLEIGAVPIVAAVVALSHTEGKPNPGFIVRKERKAHGTEKQIEGHLPKGGRVAIVDDVITKGGSILQAIKAVEAEGCGVAKVIVLLDRMEGGSEMLRERGYDFTALFTVTATGKLLDRQDSGIAALSSPRVLRK